MPTLERAISIAATAHSGQLDKGGQPYILHPLRVMMRVSTLEEKIVAVLHNVVEDTDVTLEWLSEEGFSTEVIEAVDSVTKRHGESRLQAAARAKSNLIGLVVKLADNAENLDLSRIPNVTSKDHARLKEYEAVRRFLLAPSSDVTEGALTIAQKAHLQDVFFETRTQLVSYMINRAEVFIHEQNEVGEAGRYAICIKDDPDFWVDCSHTQSKAESLAIKLGFTLSSKPS